MADIEWEARSEIVVGGAPGPEAYWMGDVGVM